MAIAYWNQKHLCFHKIKWSILRYKQFYQLLSAPKWFPICNFHLMIKTNSRLNTCSNAQRWETSVCRPFRRRRCAAVCRGRVVTIDVVVAVVDVRTIDLNSCWDRPGDGIAGGWSRATKDSRTRRPVGEGRSRGCWRRYRVTAREQSSSGRVRFHFKCSFTK